MRPLTPEILKLFTKKCFTIYKAFASLEVFTTVLHLTIGQHASGIKIEYVLRKETEFSHSEFSRRKRLNDIREILAANQIDQSYIDRWISNLRLQNEWAKI